MDLVNIPYRIDKALLIKTSMSIDHYRPNFDVPFPLLPNGVATRLTPTELHAAQDQRHILLGFKGDCSGPESSRSALAKLHNGKQIVVVCTGDSEHARHHDYKTLMLSSIFAAAPAGRGLHSFRLTEAMFFGAIPVIVDDKVVLPFCSVLDWREFSVRVARSSILSLPTILGSIPEEK
eukprot:2261980-Prymnesium_polylepis.2